MRKKLSNVVLALAAAAALLNGCAAVTKSPVPTPPSLAPLSATAAPASSASTGAKAAPDPAPFVGKLTDEPQSGVAGTEVTVKGGGMPANAKLNLNWNTAEGSWKLGGEYNEEFHGRQFKDKVVPISSVQTDASGNFQARFKVPVDWGFSHNITVDDPTTGKTLNRVNFEQTMEVTMLTNRGPEGSPITFEVKSMGYRNLENSWVVLYDNKVTGWAPSVVTQGNVRFTIPAVGGPGKHEILVNHGWSSVMYLNPQQSPTTGQRLWKFEYTVTPGDPVLPPAAERQGLKPQPGVVPSGTGPALWTEPASGPIGTPVKLLGRGLAPGSMVDLKWYRMAGNRISGQGWKTNDSTVGKVRVAEDGTISLDFTALDDLGGSHTIQAMAGDQVLAKGAFTITPSILPLPVDRGPQGTDIYVHLKGVGWTETANIYTMTYDNAYMGFGCGFNSQGDVGIHIPAAGAPGWHFIDLYPAIYKGEDLPGVQNFRYPMLTGDQEHPGERLPILHLAFYVTG